MPCTAASSAEGKPGAPCGPGRDIRHGGTAASGRTPYFHNMIGILTEIIGSPTPMDDPLHPRMHLPSGNYPIPSPRRNGIFRQSIEYSQTANRAILDLAASS